MSSIQSFHKPFGFHFKYTTQAAASSPEQHFLLQTNHNSSTIDRKLLSESFRRVIKKKKSQQSSNKGTLYSDQRGQVKQNHRQMISKQALLWGSKNKTDLSREISISPTVMVLYEQKKKSYERMPVNQWPNRADDIASREISKFPGYCILTRQDFICICTYITAYICIYI